MLKNSLTCYNIWTILTNRFALSTWCWAYIREHDDKDGRLEYYVKHYNNDGVYYSVSQEAYANVFRNPLKEY